MAGEQPAGVQGQRGSEAASATGISGEAPASELYVFISAYFGVYTFGPGIPGKMPHEFLNLSPTGDENLRLHHACCEDRG